MKIVTKLAVIGALLLLLIIALGMYKFNYLTNQPGYDVDGNFEPETEIEAVISVNNSTIYYRGEISEANYEKLLATTLDHIANLSKLMINSSGGDTVYGKKIAEFVVKHQLEVEVEQECFSSCANYIFPVGRVKYIQADALVGWHGSEFQGLLLKPAQQSFEQYQKEMVRSALLEAGFSNENIVTEQYQYMMANLTKEQAFHQNHNISTALALLGLNKLSEDLPYAGWTYSIDDMRRFGLSNIIYRGQEENYPTFSAENKDIVFVESYDKQRINAIEQIVAKQMHTLNNTDQPGSKD